MNFLPVFMTTAALSIGAVAARDELLRAREDIGKAAKTQVEVEKLPKIEHVEPPKGRIPTNPLQKKLYPNKPQKPRVWNYPGGAPAWNSGVCTWRYNLGPPGQHEDPRNIGAIAPGPGCP